MRSNPLRIKALNVNEKESYQLLTMYCKPILKTSTDKKLIASVLNIQKC